MTLPRRQVLLLPALALALALAAPPPAEACYWDRDTLAMERARFPRALELLSGNFARHSPAFYRWRIADRERALAAANSVADRLRLLDDLAVAHDKLGERERALARAREALALDDNRYETHANLGTILIHTGQLDAGLVHIERALRINPDAHFGREIVQQRLVEYVLEIRAVRPHGLPLSVHDTSAVHHLLRDPTAHEDAALEPRSPWLGPGLFTRRGFAAFAHARGLTREQALAGLLGMLKFGDHRSPVLLEAVGDVLIWDHRVKQDGKRLAARAYLGASYHAGDPWAARWYRARAALALVGHRGLSLARVEGELAGELARGERLAEKIAADEARWIAAGADVEAKFERRYLRRRR